MALLLGSTAAHAGPAVVSAEPASALPSLNLAAVHLGLALHQSDDGRALELRGAAPFTEAGLCDALRAAGAGPLAISLRPAPRALATGQLERIADLPEFTRRSSDSYEPSEARHYLLQWYLERGRVHRAWLAGREMDPQLGRRRITVAVLDTGVAYERHVDLSYRYARSPDLEGVDIAPGYDFINRDEHPNDDNQHGTFMASVIAARGGISGVAPGVRIMPIKVLDEHRAGTELALVDGIRWALRHGADVINMSLSFPVDYEPGPALRRAVEDAASAGVLLVAAAGNDGEGSVTYPAAFPEVLAVGATRLRKRPSGRLEDVLAAYSNDGPGIDLLAPGGVLDQDVNDDGHPDGILALTHDPDDPTRFSYWFQVGTSPAAAIVSGVAAMLMGAGAGAAEVRELLRTTSRPVLGGGSRIARAGQLDAGGAMLRLKWRLARRSREAPLEAASFDGLGAPQLRSDCLLCAFVPDGER